MFYLLLWGCLYPRDVFSGNNRQLDLAFYLFSQSVSLYWRDETIYTVVIIGGAFTNPCDFCLLLSTFINVFFPFYWFVGFADLPTGGDGFLVCLCLSTPLKKFILD